MASTQLKCQAPGCTITIEGASEAIALALFNSHQLHHTTPNPANGNADRDNAHKQKAPKMDRPHIGQDVPEEEWNNFTLRWDLFKRCTDMRNDETTAQLFQCCDQELGNHLLKEDPSIINGTDIALLTAMKRLAVIPVAVSVRRTELLQMRQGHGENIRSFYAKVRGKAATCNYSIKCNCHPPTDVNFTDNIIRDVIVAGLADMEVKKEVLGWTDLDNAPVINVIAHIESKEMARNALSGNSITAGISHFKKQQRATTTPSEKTKTAKCPNCSSIFNLFSEGTRGWNAKPHQQCLDCWRKTKPRFRSKNKNFPTESQHSENSGLIMKIGAIDTVLPPLNSNNTVHFENGSIHTPLEKRAIELNHHIFTEHGWVAARSLTHPTIRLRMTTNKDDYDSLGSNFPYILPKYLEVITDTGAQSCLWSRNDFDNCGFRASDLIPVTYGMTAANKTQFQIDGAILVRLAGHDKNNKPIQCAVMAYVSPDAKGFYLSREAMAQLGIISETFPQVGAAFNCAISPNILAQTSDLSANTSDDVCDCPKRNMPPGPPESLPFDCISENIEHMKKWLLDRYKSSTFNTCPHQLLPDMDGPPIKILVKPDATPVAAYTPATVPIHWQEQVEKDLLRDEALGVIERVPHNEPMSWCHRMVITRKSDGGPRRTVDLSPLNKQCLRETHAMKSPFQLARSVPPHSWKTVTDAWNGYHSVPIRKEDRHLTTFITPIGRFRYTRAPQGFLSSGDGYNRRFDEILADFTRKQRCVDDTLHYDQDLDTHWWRTIEFLEMVGKAGIILNPKKFQFSQHTADFAGFRISDNSVEPLPKYVDAIKNFPTPTSLTDMRSWFGLVNQVAHYAQLREIMTPFKPLLSPNTRFTWTTNLDEAFKASKDQIVRAIQQGVEIFDITRPTCLRTDWSKSGIGYYLSQKHCKCDQRSPGCCENGWRITLAGSRFLSSAEQRYAPVEGEMLGVAWGLEQTKYFTQGCDNLLVVTDHKPLTKLLGDRTLDEITNTRLFRLKQRTLMWRFDIEHQPGKSNNVADATSRHPVPEISHYADVTSTHLQTEEDGEETTLMAAIRSEVDKLAAVTWQHVQQETQNDDNLRSLIPIIENGFPKNKSDLPPCLLPFWEFRNCLYVTDGVILYNDRVIVPSALRISILDVLHSAHQGVSAMTARAQSSVYWPGITRQIQERRDSCASCNRNAPSNARMPPTPPLIPTTPFEAVFADFFEYRGWHYLVTGDRLSGWTEVYRTRTGTTDSGAKGLGSCLRRLFVTFGVPEELSSDGGPEFTARETQQFLQRWGTHHRISSAYHPQSNGRAELAVKATKRLLEDNVGPNGNLDTDTFVRAMLTLRNTPDQDCKISPAQILFGRQLRDAMPTITETTQKFTNTDFQPLWRNTWAAKEDALRTRYARTFEALTQHSRSLPALIPGNRVFIQNQEGNHPKKWDRSGTVVECRNNDQYFVKVDGTGRLTMRNRAFLRKFEPHSIYTHHPPTLIPTSKIIAHSPPQLSNESDVRKVPELTQPTPTDVAIHNQSTIPPHDAQHMPESTTMSPSTDIMPNSIQEPPTPTRPEKLLRRSSREKKAKLMYDPSSGSYVHPN